MKGFDKYQGEDEIRAALETHFADAGTVVSVRLPSDRETGELKGIGFIQFDSAASKVSSSGEALCCRLRSIEPQAAQSQHPNSHSFACPDK